MASKWAKQKGKIPGDQTVREQAFYKYLEEYQGQSLDELTTAYNAAEARGKEMSAVVKDNDAKMDALEFLARKNIDASGADNVSINGFTWSPTVEPYAAVKDSAALVAYYIENKMYDMLSVHPSKVTSAIKGEIEDGTILIETEMKPGPDGQEVEVQVVKSSILPGVSVFLKDKLGRRKTTAAKE